MASLASVEVASVSPSQTLKNLEQVGRDLEVVVERIEGGLARGTARQWVTVRWPAAPGDARGALVRVRVQATDGSACVGVRSATFESRLPP